MWDSEKPLMFNKTLMFLHVEHQCSICFPKELRKLKNKVFRTQILIIHLFLSDYAFWVLDSGIRPSPCHHLYIPQVLTRRRSIWPRLGPCWVWCLHQTRLVLAPIRSSEISGNSPRHILQISWQKLPFLTKRTTEFFWSHIRRRCKSTSRVQQTSDIHLFQ